MRRRLWTALLTGSAQLWAVAAYIREIIKAIYKYEMRSVGISQAIRRSRGLLQGCPLSPMAFNKIMEQVMRRCRKKWRRAGL